MTEKSTRPLTAVSFNQYLSEGKLMGSNCQSCSEISVPPRAICHQCHSTELEWTEFSGAGRLDAFTSIYIAPTFMIDQGFGRDKPYLTGIVALEEGVKISARILGLDAARPEQNWIGSAMRAAFLTRGEGDDSQIDLAFEFV